MTIIAGTAIAGLSPIEFDMKLVADSLDKLLETIKELVVQYPFIDQIAQLDTCPVDIDGLILMETRVTLDKDADYLQLCALRADLASRPYV